MWIRKHINRLNHWLSLRESNNLLSVVYWRGRFECLDPKLFKRLQVATACVSKLEADLPTIAHFNRLFASLLIQSFTETAVDFTAARSSPATTTVEAFFKDKRGHFLDASSEVLRFKQQALQLTERFKALETIDSADARYNLRKLRALLIHSAKVAEQLRLYSLDEHGPK